MKLLDYIRGARKGKEAHRLEKEAMRDPFLADALEGYSRVGNGADVGLEPVLCESVTMLWSGVSPPAC